VRQLTLVVIGFRVLELLGLDMKLISALLCLVLCSGCSSTAFYGQAVAGQLDLLMKRQSIDSVLQDPDAAPAVKARLALVQQIRVFARDNLHLPVGQAYSSYSDLERPFALWNIYVAPELSLESHQWCYPIAGCFSYRGFFDESSAHRDAKDFLDQGYDVKVGGILAYSTVGWFDDPVLNTFLLKSEPYLVKLLIHEIAHRKMYIKSDTQFNENFATAVALLGSEQWYRQRENERLYKAYKERLNTQQEITELLLGVRQQLNAIYIDDVLSVEEKRSRKNKILQSLQQSYQRKKIQRGWDNRYDQWVASTNNATLANLVNYEALVPHFIRLFRECGNDWALFFQRVSALSKLPMRQRHAALSSNDLEE